jgi:hypothetical protein
MMGNRTEMRDDSGTVIASWEKEMGEPSRDCPSVSHVKAYRISVRWNLRILEAHERWMDI